jgi:Mn2+/Fe2+ NRAMP family transporter
MTGEISIAGVYFPSLLLLAVIAAVLTGIATRLLSFFGAYRAVAYRPLVDLALFVIILGLLSLFTGSSS